MPVNRSRHNGRFPCCILLFVFTGSAGFATAPQLASINPAGAQRGTDLQLAFTGDRLQDAQEILCYEQGIEVQSLDLVTNTLVKASVKIMPDCAFGEHHLRLRTSSGISELRTFFVGAFPTVPEIEPNNVPSQAQKVALNTTIAGVITSEDVDCFAVEVKSGERLSAEVEGMRLGRGVFDPLLSVLDSDGTLLAKADDTWLAGQDPFLSFVAQHDGTYLVQLLEATFGGNGNCHYRLHVGNFPRPTSVYPLGGTAGETVELTYYSDATGEFRQQTTLPALPQDKYGVFAELDHLPAPSPNWLRVSPFPNVLLQGETPNREHAITVGFPAPFALNGIICAKGEQDWFGFPALKGIPLELSVYARRLRSPLDSVLEVFDATGRSIASNDDAEGTDSALKFTPKATTNYFVSIRDTLGRFGRDYTYRIEVTPSAPRVTVKIPEVARNDTQSRQYIAVPRGNRFATLISAKRANFNGELHFELPGLPAAVTMSADVLAPNIETEPLVFEAAADAPLIGSLSVLTARGTNETGNVSGEFQQQVELVEGPNNTSYYSTTVNKLCVAVVKALPFRLHIVEPKVPLVQGGSMGLEIVAERDPGFDAPIEVAMVWNPPGVSSQSEATIAQGSTNVLYQLNAGDNAEPHVWNIAALGHATVEGGQAYCSSQLAPLQITTPFVAGKIQTLSATPGSPATLTVKLETKKPFEGKSKIRLLGLPDKITAAEREITQEDQSVSFDLSIDPKCQPGSFKNLFCAVDVVKDGQVIPHRIASGGILRVNPAKGEATKLAKSAESKK